MHRLLTFLPAALLGAALAGGAAPLPPDVIARIHFAGAARISADPDSTAFTNFFCAADAIALESQTLDKLSRAPSKWFQDRIPAGAGDGAAQLRPLLDDFLKSEWLLQAREAAGGSLEYTLAIRLDKARAALWQSNLTGLLQSWTKMPGQSIPNGWQLIKHVSPNTFRFIRTGDWVVIGCGDNELPMTDELCRRLGAGMSPVDAEETGWVNAHLDWPRLAHWFPALSNFDLPIVALQIVGRNGNLQLSGTMYLAQPLPPLEKWRMPDEIHPPFTSFTAVRGVGPWLARQPWARPFEIQPPPDEFFLWETPEYAFQNFAAVPVADAKDALRQLNARLSASGYFAPDLRSCFLFPIRTELSGDEIAWRGLPPLLTPYVQALHEASGDFLFGGLFVNPPRIGPLPPELTDALKTPNIVYYHLELTGTRLGDMHKLTQLLLALTFHRELAGNSAAFKWLNRITPSLGPSVTRVTQTAPDQLAFIRSATTGLTALEWVALANWLEGPNFPGFDLRLPPGQRGLQRPLPHRLTAPPTPAPKPPPAH